MSIAITPKKIIPSSNNCPFGYNYNVEFTYNITVSGVNTCFNGDIGIQPQILCNSQSNGYYTISVPAPIVGNPSAISTYSGTLTTTSNPFRSTADCNSATPNSLNCNSLLLNVFGPGLAATAYTCSLALPIELSAFHGRCDGSATLLDWTTATETNNDFFSLEHSTNAVDWSVVARIDGAGNSSQPLHYAYTDKSAPAEHSYYRLKQTDFDGTSRYSDILPVRSCAASLASGELGVFPNPTTGILNFSFNGDQDQIRTVEIYSELGALVYSTTAFQPSIDLSAQQSGMYIVRGQLDDKTLTKRITLEN